LKPSSESFRGGWLPLLIIVLVTTLLFADVLLGNRTLYFRDIYNNHLPLKVLQAEQIRDGVLPLWNPGLSGGQPLLANLNLFTFHPATLLFLALDPVSAVNWTVFLQLLLAGWAMFLLARRLGWGDAGALFSGLAFALSGFMLSLGNLLNMLNSAAWLPLTAWLFLRWRQQGAPWAGLGCLGSLSVQLLGGDPGMALVSVLLMALLVFRQDEEGGSLRGLVSVAGLSLAAAGLCGLQLLPFRELVTQTVRGWGFTYRGATFWSIHPLRLVELHLPSFYGDVDSTTAGALWGNRLFDDGFPLILSIYVGQAVLLFAALALLRWRRDRDVLLLGLFLGAGLLFSLGGHTPFYRLVYAMPGAGGMRFPSRFLIMVVLALALLAGRAFGRVAGGKRPAPWFGVTAMGWAMAGAVVLSLVMWHGGLGGGPPGRGLLAQLFLFSSAALLLAVTRRRLGRPVFIAIGLLLLVADLGLFGAGVNFRTDRSFFSSVPPAAEAIRADSGQDGWIRVHRRDKPQGITIDPPAKEKEWICLWDRSLLSPPSGLLSGVGYDLGITTDLLSPRTTAEAARRMHRGGLAWQRLMWDLCAVDYVLGFDELDVPGLTTVHRTTDFSTISMVSQRNETALPRARLVSEARFADQVSELDMVFAPGFDTRHQVVLPAGAGDGFTAPVEGADPGSCRIVHDGSARVEVVVEAGQPCWLVLADTWFPGWEARVDGEPRLILRANSLHRAVRVEPRDRVVTFTYSPRSWRAGLIISLATVLLVGVCFGLAVFRRRREGRGNGQ